MNQTIALPNNIYQTSAHKSTSVLNKSFGNSNHQGQLNAYSHLDVSFQNKNPPVLITTVVPKSNQTQLVAKRSNSIAKTSDTQNAVSKTLVKRSQSTPRNQMQAAPQTQQPSPIYVPIDRQAKREKSTHDLLNRTYVKNVEAKTPKYKVLSHSLFYYQPPLPMQKHYSKPVSVTSSAQNKIASTSKRNISEAKSPAWVLKRKIKINIF